MKKALSIAVCFVLLFSLIISGCGKQTASDQSGTQPSVPADISKLKGSFTYWVNQDWSETDKQLVEKFQKDYPNIKIKMTPFTYDTLIEKLRASYSANQESDMQQIFGDWATDLMKNARLAEVPSDMSQDAKNRYYESCLAGYTYNGKLYGIPREYNIENGGVLYYPEDLSKVGYNEFPKTYDELVDAAKKLTQYDTNGNPTHWGFDFISTDNVPYLFLSFILQQGADYWSDDKVHVKFTTPEAEKAFQATVDLVVKYKVTEVKHLNDANNEAHVAFFKGFSSMCFRGPWVTPVGTNEFKLTNFKYGKMPSFTGNSMAFAAETGWGDVVSARSKNKEAAWAFIRYMSTPENNEFWNASTCTIPADKKVAESPSFVEKQPLIKTSLEVLSFGKPIGPLQSVDAFKVNIVSNHFFNVCTGGEDVKTALQKIEQETNSMIDEKLAQ